MPMTGAASHAEHGSPELDLFIVHAAADVGFVRDYLLPALDLPRSRVLLVDELPVGGFIVSEIDRVVTRSRYTLAILSPAYLEDRWADFGEQLAACLRADRPRVIPLRLRDCARSSCKRSNERSERQATHESNARVHGS